MARSRLNLQTTLVSLPGIAKVYFQPPETVKLDYPCIIYSLADIEAEYADDIKYHKERKYSLILIDRNPDTPLVESISELPYCSFDRYYTADNLNHWVFTLYY